MLDSIFAVKRPSNLVEGVVALFLTFQHCMSLFLVFFVILCFFQGFSHWKWAYFVHVSKQN